MSSTVDIRRATDDRYPSRRGGRPMWLPRIDPVVYGGTGPLGAAELENYERYGYLALDGFFSVDDIAPYVAELEQLRSARHVGAVPEAVTEPDSGELRSLFAIHRPQPVLDGSALGRLCRHPRIVAIARQLLGGDVYIHQSRINYKAGYRGEPFYWHSDFETWHVEDGVPAMRMLSCSISLTPNTEFNGPLMVIPGSHRHFVSCVGHTPDQNYLRSLQQQELGVPDDDSLKALIDDGGIAAPKGPAGSVTFFECNLMHGSGANITPDPRSNVFVVFNSIDNRPVAPYCGLPPRPNFIAEREDFTPAHRMPFMS